MEHFADASLNSGPGCGVLAKRRQSSPAVFAVKALGGVRVLLAMTVSLGQIGTEYLFRHLRYATCVVKTKRNHSIPKTA
jgi:hypothetical protein